MVCLSYLPKPILIETDFNYLTPPRRHGDGLPRGHRLALLCLALSLTLAALVGALVVLVPI